MTNEVNLNELWNTIIEQKANHYKDCKEDLSEINVVLHNATWCPDCVREATDLLAMIKVMGKRAPKLTVISYEDKSDYKEKKSLNLLPIKCLPTIVISTKGEVEIGRIEEEARPTFKESFFNVISKSL